MNKTIEQLDIEINLLKTKYYDLVKNKELLDNQIKAIDDEIKVLERFKVFSSIDQKQ